MNEYLEYVETFEKTSRNSFVQKAAQIQLDFEKNPDQQPFYLGQINDLISELERKITKSKDYINSKRYPLSSSSRTDVKTLGLKLRDSAQIYLSSTRPKEVILARLDEALEMNEIDFFTEMALTLLNNSSHSEDFKKLVRAKANKFHGEELEIVIKANALYKEALETAQKSKLRIANNFGRPGNFKDWTQQYLMTQK